MRVVKRILGFGDLHLDASKDHRHDALADHEATLDAILQLAVDRNVDLVTFSGDAYDRPGPSVAAQHVMQRFLRRLTALNIPMVAIHGNAGHDLVNGHESSALELHDSRLVRVSRAPEVITEFAGINVCTLPSVPVAKLVADHDGGDRGEINELAAHLLIETARDLRQSPIVKSAAPTILLAHWSISGSALPAGLPVDDLNEPVLDLNLLEALDFDAIIAAHIHNPQMFGRNVAYTGTPMCLNFGEAHVQHGVWIVDLDDGDTRWEYVEIPGRPFVTIAAELDENTVDPTDAIAEAVAAQFPITDAVARISYRATEEAHRRVDAGAILRLLDDAGVHKVYGGLRPDIVKTTGGRADGVNETVAPLEAIDAWCRVNDVAPDMATDLSNLTAELLEVIA